jgi:hypothetical protein
MNKIIVLILAMVLGTGHFATAKEYLKGRLMKPMRARLSKSTRADLCWEFTASTTNEQICLSDNEISPAQVVSGYTMTTEDITEAICLKKPGSDSEKDAQCYFETPSSKTEQFCLLNDDSLDPEDFEQAIEAIIGYGVTLPEDARDFYVYDPSDVEI